MKSVVFNKGAQDFLLSALNKSIDSDGYIIDNTNGKKVPSLDGTYITGDEFAGVVKGSELYVKSDIVSLIEASDRVKAESK